MGTTGQSVTLANSIIGVGILAMPFCFQQCGILLATLILLSMGLVSRLCCYFLLKSAIITRRRNYEFLAFHVFGPAGKIAIETGIIGFLMGTCIAYFVVVGDLGPQIIAKLLNINQSDMLRTSIMVIVSLVCVLPLGLLRNVDSLSNVSAATIAFYFCLVIKVITEATSQLLSSDWHTRIEMWKPSGLLQCVPIFSMALFCQTQLFEIFDALPSLSLEKMCVVTKNAINICSAVYFTLGLFGYIAFGSQEISGNILMSLSPTMASDVIKLGFVMSLAFSFPLIIFPCRASLYSFLYRKAHAPMHEHLVSESIPERSFRLLTVGIVCAALVVSLLLPSVELVLGLLGATVGVLICLVFPAACFLQVTYKDTNERLLAKFVVILGLIILVLGTYANLQAAENTRDKYEDFTKERIDKFVEDFFQKQEKFEGLKSRPFSANKVQSQIATNLLDSAIVKDSEVQPPNPVPPESQFNEKLVDTPISKSKVENKVENVLDKASESHPRNLQIKSNGEKIANGNKVDSPVITDVNEPPKAKEEKQSSSQDKIEIQKQQQLIETIKQHGEEQKELIQEQKEILDGLLKTKEELQKNKKEVDSKEVKIKAVESIQQIAKMAIQSIGGVTDKPEQGKNNPPEPLKEIAAEAVNEIAKKAVETLDAIKQIDEKEKTNSPKDKNEKETLNEANEDQHTIVDDNIQIKQIPKQIVTLSEVVNEQKPSIKRSIENPKSIDTIKNIPEINNNTKFANSNTNYYVEKLQNVKNDLSENDKHILYNNLNEEKKMDNPVAEKTSNVIGKNAQNLPLPIALKDNTRINNENSNIIKTNLVNNGASNDNSDKVSNKESIASIRQKREVVDCTQKTTLKPEDKQICENLVDKPDKIVPQKEILPIVNLADDAISKSLPIPLMAVHHMRSLKSYEEKQR